MSRERVPGVWYDLSSRLSAALTVVDSIGLYMPCGAHAKPVMSQLDGMGNLAAAASEILRLCKADCEALEAALLDER